MAIVDGQDLTCSRPSRPRTHTSTSHWLPGWRPPPSCSSPVTPGAPWLPGAPSTPARCCCRWCSSFTIFSQLSVTPTAQHSKVVQEKGGQLVHCYTSLHKQQVLMHLVDTRATWPSVQQPLHSQQSMQKQHLHCTLQDFTMACWPGSQQHPITPRAPPAYLHQVLA